MDIDPADARDLFGTGRVAVLGTLSRAGAPPHLVPVTFAVSGDEVWTAVDEKPKAPTGRPLARLENVRADPHVSLLVQQWREDWAALWWVRAEGPARVSDRADDVTRAAGLLRGKYEQYDRVGVTGPVIIVRVTRWQGWSAASP